jgi:peptidoglycan/LPS O-acetylase OafA/YrhL
MTTTTSDLTPTSVGASHQRRDVQGLRAVAVLVVVAFHAGLPLSGGFTGVDMFFVISGFVITGLLLREHRQQRLSLRTFFARRAKRLLPALALMISVVLFASLFFESPLGSQTVTVQTAIGAMLISANMVIARTVGGYFDPAAEANPLLHTWSLSVEEQFYLLFPLLLILAWRLRGKWLLALLGGVAGASFLLNVLLTFAVLPTGFTSQPGTWAFYLAPTRAWEFLVGAILAVLVQRGSVDRLRRSLVSQLLAWGGVLLILYSVFFIEGAQRFPGFIALAPVLGTAALILVGSLGRNPVSQVLGGSAFVAVGDRSYSIYLWHWPVIVFAILLFPGTWTALTAAAVSFIPALVSYQFVEQPMRIRPLTSRATVLIWSLTVTGVVVCLALLVGFLGSRLVPFTADRGETTSGIQRDCLIVDREFTVEDIDRCRVEVGDGRGWILLTGDSHAESLTDGVIAAATELGFDVVAVTGADCTIARGNFSNARVPNCAEMADALLNTLTSADPPAAVVLAQRGVPGGIESTYREIADSNVPLVRVQDVPMWRPWESSSGPNPCSGGLLNFTCTQSVDEVRRNASASREEEMRVIEGLPNVVNVDPWTVFCSADSCSPVVDDQIAYFDSAHLNVWGSRALTSLLTDAIREASISR